MPTNINFDKKLGISGGTNIILPSVSPVPSFADTNSFQFDGVTDYIAPLITSGLDFSGSFTLSAWVKTNAIGTSQFIIDTSTSLTNGNGYSIYLHSSGIIRFWSYHTAGLVDSTTVLSASTWYHVACVHDTVSGTNKIYIDGILENTSAYIHANTSNTTNLWIGRSHLFASSFDGFINEVGFFGTDESANINSIFNGGLPDSLTSFNPSSWFRMGEKATWNGSKFVLDNQGSIGGTATSVGITPTDPNPTTDVPLFDNKSFTYDGSLDYVDCGTITALNGGVSVFSTSLWFKYSGTLSTSDNIILSGGSTSSDDFYIQPTSATNIRYGHSSSFTDTTVSTMSINTWYNLILVHSTTSFSIYLNGILQGSSTGKPSPATNLGTNFNIGRYNISSAFNFNGLINDISVFNTDESSNALTIFNGGIVNDISSLNPLGYWRAEEVTFDGSNWTLIDQGSGANNGTSVSMPLTSRTSDVPT